MSVGQAIRSFSVGQLSVEVLPNREELGQVAAAAVAECLRSAVAARGLARFVMGTGPSQLSYVTRLVGDRSLAWDRIELFHLDEYVGIAADHPASFRRWLREKVADRVHPRAVHYVQGDSADPAAECRRYAALLARAPIDAVSIGIGENGHIAFNDPPVADFNDPLAVKVVTLDEGCKRQQVGEGSFPSLEAVPPRAISVTIPTMMKAARIFCVVPDTRKAQAVKNALEGPIATSCPASILRRQSHARLLLDAAAASLLAA